MDIRTLLICFLALLCLQTIGLLLVQARARELYGTGWLAAAFAVTTLGAGLVAARGYVADIWSIVAGNALIMAGYLVLHQAVAEFLRLGRRHVFFGAALLAGLVLGTLYFTFAEDSTQWRIVLVSLAYAAQGGLSARLLFGARGEGGLRLSLRFVGTVLGAFAALNLLRALLTAWGGAPADFMRNDAVQAGSLLAFILTTSAVGFGFVWMTMARLLDAFDKRAGQDELTGLLNRRGFMVSARVQRALAERSGDSLLLLFADLDGLKEINDAGGHALGDQALVDAAAVLRAALPSDALIARLGGDEFCALLTVTDLSWERAVLRRIEEQVAARNAGTGRTYSLGISAAAIRIEPEESDTLEEFIAVVDNLMYVTKRARKGGDSEPSFPRRSRRTGANHL